VSGLAALVTALGVAVPGAERRLALAAAGGTAAGGTSTATTTGGQFPTVLLTALVWSSLAALVVVLLLPDRTDEQRGRIRVVALVGAAVPLLLATFGLNYQIGQELVGGTISFEENRSWLTSLPVQSVYHLGVDGISLPLLLLSTLLFVVAVLASWRLGSRVRLHLALLLLMETGVNGVLCSLDYSLYLLFWGMQILSAFLLLALWGGPDRVRAAWRYLGVASVGWALLLATAVLLAVKVHATPPTFDFDKDNTVGLSHGVSTLGFWLSFLAFAATLPVVPVHTWARDAITEAATPLGVLLRGTVMSLAAYGLMRITLTAFPDAAHRFGLVVVVLAVVTTLWGTAAAFLQDDLRRLLAYSAIAQMGLVLLAIGSASAIALNGAVLMLVADGLVGGMLLLLAGAVQERTRTRSIARLGGLAWQMPKLTGLWVMAGLAMVGVPFLASFVAEFMIVTGSFPVHRVATVVVLASTLATTGYVLWMLERVLFGPSREAFARLRDATTLELACLVPMAIAVLILGVLPGRMLPVINNGVQSVVSRFTGS
jgi:NADH-quinone oxidoreductase subunit M